MWEQPECDVEISRGHGNEILGSLSSCSKKDNHVLKTSATRYKYARSAEGFESGRDDQKLLDEGSILGRLRIAELGEARRLIKDRKHR